MKPKTAVGPGILISITVVIIAVGAHMTTPVLTTTPTTTKLTVPTITVTMTTTPPTTATVTTGPVTWQSDLIIRVLSIRRNVSGWYVIRGEVFNNGTNIARCVSVHATFFDDDLYPQFTAQNVTNPSDIYPGKAAFFEVSCTNEHVSPLIEHFELRVKVSS